MIEVYKNLYVGNSDDLAETINSKDNWSIVHAAKEPYHRSAVGYTGRALNKDHPEYLFALRDRELSLNIVDTPSPLYFCNEIFDRTLKFIGEGLKDSGKVLVHCNQGESRSPSIAFLYMASKSLLPADFTEAKEQFAELYPGWKPKGIIGYIEAHWNEYIKEKVQSQGNKI